VELFSGKGKSRLVCATDEAGAAWFSVNDVDEKPRLGMIVEGGQAFFRVKDAGGKELMRLPSGARPAVEVEHLGVIEGSAGVHRSPPSCTR
jgi:hypothetical protein